MDALVQRESERLGYARRRRRPEEILERCLLALVNEGAKILEEKIAANALGPCGKSRNYSPARFDNASSFSNRCTNSMRLIFSALQISRS